MQMQAKMGLLFHTSLALNYDLIHTYVIIKWPETFAYKNVPECIIRDYILCINNIHDHDIEHDCPIECDR